MMEDSLLDQYARLVVGTGVHLQRDQMLVINSPIECAEFARRIAREAYEEGAHDVAISWGDEEFSHLRFLKAKPSVFGEFPDWRRRFYEDYAEQGAAFVTISARNPEIFKDVEPERLTTESQAAGAALMDYRARLMSNRNTWCVVSVPTRAWAEKVFPELSAGEAVERLWQEIYAAVRIEKDGDPVQAWEEHTAFLGRAADFMNGHAFRSLHYRNSLGTDLIVELPEGHIWAGGAEYSDTGVRFVANLPTEEVYTLPKRDGVNGTVVATRPLNFHGNLIEGFRLVFREGRVVDYRAEKGQEILGELLSTDEGSHYLGEVALVPYDSPISRSGILFYHTLFDENASCHLALGKAYPTCIEGGTDMQSVELLQHGVNDSLLHEDFMIGSRDLSILGRTKDGREVPVFVDGNFAF